MMRATRSLAIALWPGSLCLALSPLAGASAFLEEERSPTIQLRALLEDYFKSPTSEAASEKIDGIEKLAGGDVRLIASELPWLRLWSAIPEREMVVSVDAGSQVPSDVTIRTPNAYDATQSYPAILCMPRPGRSRRDDLDVLVSLLGEAGEKFVWVRPDKPAGGSFHQPHEEGRDLRRLLREVRKKVHIDVDRMYLFGVDSGGDAAWIAAIGYPDLFAAAVIVGGYPQLPYPEQLLRILLPNLENLPILALWPKQVAAATSGRDGRPRSYRRFIEALAVELNLPYQSAEFESIRRLNPAGIEAAIQETFSRERRLPTRFALWYRYVEQGQTSWLRTLPPPEPGWEDQQISILSGPKTDRAEFITEVLKSQLSYLGGEISGQKITIETIGSQGALVYLPLGAVDMTQPIRVDCNGRKRMDGPVQPNVRTMLEIAYEEWDFEHPAVARLGFGIHTDRRR